MQQEDLSLIAQEPEIVGLRIVLNETEMLRLLQKQLPNAGICSVKKTYLRFKPRTNCIVRYHVESQYGSNQWYVKAYTDKDQDKLNRIESTDKTKSNTPFVIREHLLILYPFPLDDKLKLLPRLFEPFALQALLKRVFYSPTFASSQVSSIELLQYKPERRLVAKLRMSSGETLVLKAYTKQRYHLANLSRRHKLNSQKLLDTVGRSNKHHLLLHRWIEGENLTHYYHLQDNNSQPFYDCGRYLGMFHLHSKTKQIVTKDTDEFVHDLKRCASGIVHLVPELESSLAPLVTQLLTELKLHKSVKSVIHGDFYAKQVLVTSSGIRLIDFDDVCYWFSGYDLGLFIAHLERDRILGTLSTNQTQEYQEALLNGYREQQDVDQSEIELFIAIGLLQLSHHPFRNALPKWKASICQLIKRCKQHLSNYQLLTHCDELFQTLPAASELLAIPSAEQILRDSVAHLTHEDHLMSIDVVRHKPTKRALIEYTFSRDDGEQQSILGKVKIKHFDKHAWQINCALHQANFNQDSCDEIMVPTPLGKSREHHIWFQNKVAGQVSLEKFCHSDGIDVAERAAQALYKLHSSGIKIERTHTINHEIDLLERYLTQAGSSLPSRRTDIGNILEYCQLTASNLPTPASLMVIHRDFYHDQLLIDNNRLYLLDLDLCCNGDPALDIGNFIAHIEEQCLRCFNKRDYAQKQIDRFIEHYQQLAGDDLRQCIETYTLLSWARHIFISQRISERNQWTEQIIQVCKDKIRQNIK
ncbi:phosphotransferase [Vibrio ouci]|uniref:Aminoglycoside phosphotransferase domain-containing protein n=1 Tax=Vibrio ouci TaxID=2499078 RepID=A0A4Y8WFN2_9VIBR|nr:phosphotransferase [Vibrio ouci]TFH91614.1 hypothetical protein ELS82_10985 [Vibrio ouci]